jgi:hypothetical protein
VATLSRKLNAMSSSGEGLENREKRKLSFLEHFHRRMVNLPLCPEDRKRVDAVLAEYVSAIKGNDRISGS